MPEVLQPATSYTGLARQGLCNPVRREVRPSIAYSKYFSDKKFTVSIRLLYTMTDIPFVFDWVNQEYAKRFWQMDNQPIEQLKTAYQVILACDFAQPFIGLLNGDPICEVDVYK